MIIYPAIDLYEGKAVRLYKGDYSQMTVYHDNPLEVAEDFKASGATHMHIVDLQGASTPEIFLMLPSSLAVISPMCGSTCGN